jgi:hypothetical protein
MVARETPKVRTISFLGVPQSTAASARKLKSFEYAFILPASHEPQLLCKLLWE